MNHLLHPEFIMPIPFVGNHIAEKLNYQASMMADTPVVPTPITIAVRTLNEAEKLEQLIEDIDQQKHFNDLELLVVDNESSDRTAQVARSLGATVINLARDDFTYPKSKNLAVEAASHDTVMLTVGHARLSNTQTLRAMTHTMKEGVAGSFARTLPNENASTIERWLAIGNAGSMKKRYIHKAGLGVMGATNAVISKGAWEELGRFDERFERGGEDTALAKRMLEAGWNIVDEPLLAVHHTHGLGLRDTYRQWRTWLNTLNGPQAFDRAVLARRRPDLSFD